MKSGGASSSGSQPVQQEKEQTGREKAEEAIIDAEKYKAIVEPPAGECSQLIGLQVGGPDKGDDDDLFDVAIHVEDTNQSLIAKGDFVEINKLVPKRESKPDESDKPLKLINKEGKTFLVAGEDSETTKVMNVKKWTEGFRVYAAIYSKANPHRAHEIIQYMHTITSAAASFAWSNVAYYDYTFRKIMAQRPYRSWAKIHTQLWSTAMRNPFPSHNGNSNSQKKKEKDNICWKFNRNRCRDGEKCRFEHRCSYCFSYGHPAVSCNRKRKNEENDGKKKGKKHRSSEETSSTS